MQWILTFNGKYRLINWLTSLSSDINNLIPFCDLSPHRRHTVELYKYNWPNWDILNTFTFITSIFWLSCCLLDGISHENIKIKGTVNFEGLFTAKNFVSVFDFYCTFSQHFLAHSLRIFMAFANILSRKLFKIS